MGRRGRSNDFRRHWHRRQLEPDDGDVLTWALIDEPGGARAPHAACFRRMRPEARTEASIRPRPSRCSPRSAAKNPTPDPPHDLGNGESARATSEAGVSRRADASAGRGLTGRR